MIRVTIFTHNLGYGGIEKYTCDLCNMLTKFCKVKLIVSYKYNESSAFYLNPNVELKYLIYDKPDSISIKSLLKQFQISQIFKEIKRRKKLKKLFFTMNKKEVEEIDSNYIITTRVSLNEIVSKYLNNSKVICIATEHNDLINDNKYNKNLINSLKRFDYLVLPTKKLFDFYKSQTLNPKCIKISNTTELLNIKKADINTHNLIYVGRLSPEKGLFDLIDVIYELKKEIPDINLNILGDGYIRKKLEEYSIKLNLEKNIYFRGYVDISKQRNYYQQSSLFVLTSFTEAFGLVLIESMNYGVPCIAFDSASGACELLKDNVGMLINKRNIKKMAYTIERYLLDSKIRSFYQKKALFTVKQFSPNKIINDWKKIIK